MFYFSIHCYSLRADKHLLDYPHVMQVLDRRVAFVFAVAVGFESVVALGKSFRLSAQSEDAANLVEAQHSLVVVTHQNVSRPRAGHQMLQRFTSGSRPAIAAARVIAHPG